MRVKNIFLLLSILLLLIVCPSCDNFSEDDYIYPNDSNNSQTENATSNKDSNSGLNSDSLSNDILNSDNDNTDSLIKDDSEVDIPSQTDKLPTDSFYEDVVPDIQKSIVVTFDTDGGEGLEPITIVTNSNYTLPTPVMTGYKFEGWYNNEIKIALNGIWQYSEDLTLTAKWSVATYTIKYDLNGGKIDDSSSLPSTYQFSKKITRLGIPHKKGNVKFIGWQVNNTDEVFYDIPKNYAKDLNLKALWYEYEYTYKTEEGFLLFLKKDGTLSVVGYEGKVNNLLIPAEYKGYTVNEIGKYAFACFGVLLAEYESFGFLRCDIPETVTKISEGAFSKCDDLKVQFYDSDAMSLEDWLLILEIEDRNDHVYDVILGKRPAIGWNKYYIP